MVKHIVTFKLKGSSEERRAYSEDFKAALLALPEEVPELRSIEVGINENPAESWDIALVATVDTMADVEAYSKHPAHVAAAAIISDVKADRACVDFEC